jgi:hypothetical protein
VIWRSAAPAAMREAALSVSCEAALASSEELESKVSTSIPGLDPCNSETKFIIHFICIKESSSFLP